MGWGGGLGLIIMSNLNLSKVKLMLGWVVTIYMQAQLFEIFKGCLEISGVTLSSLATQ